MVKKKSIIIGITALIFLAIGICLLTRPTLLGNMNGSYTQKTTLNSDISFSADAGDRIKFSFRSNVKSGDLDIVLYDSQGNIVYDLDKATKLETFFTFDSLDNYILAAECNDFVGSFKISVFKASHKPTS